MAKGDDKRARNQIDRQGGLAQNNLDNLRTGILWQNQDFQNNYRNAVNQANVDYPNIMGKFREFSETGGYSDQDLSNIRSRALSPTRAVYANANRNVDRQRALQGGYSPGYGVLKSRMARDMSQGLSDASTNAEAQIAQMQNQGRQFGTSGMLNAYGTTPGAVNMYGNQLLGSSGQLVDLQGLQNQLGLGTMNAQIAAAGIKGPWQQAYDNVLGGIGTVAGAVKPWGE